ncbi:MAG: hypothetical protein EBX41_01160 [Chitinophagia bacterium]|nr:hypothetical protein [Chitinophagia bacterium]
MNVIFINDNTAMYFNKTIRFSAIVAFAALFLSVGCIKSKKETNAMSDGEDNGGYAGDASKIEWINNDVISLADAAGTYYNGVYMRVTNTFGDCATVATDTLSNPHVITIRFGDKNCRCLDGNNRRGSIVISYYGRYSDSNSSHTITYHNYAFNDMQLKGNVVATRVDTTVVGSWYYNIKVDDTLVTKPNAYLKWKGLLVRRQVAGYTTGDRSDNEYTVSGSATLTRENGHVFVFDIATPLHFTQDCPYVKSGVVNVSGYLGARIINYGFNGSTLAGGCDRDAQLKIGLYTYNIQL